MRARGPCPSPPGARSARAAGAARRAAPRGPGRAAAPRATPRRGRGRRCRKFGGEGSKMSQHTWWQVRAPAFTWAPRVQGRLPRTAPTPRTRPACTSRSQSGMGVLGFGTRHAAICRTAKGACRGAVNALAPAPRAQRGSSCTRAAPSPLVLLPPPRGVHIGHLPGLRCASRGFWCAARPATAA